MKPFKLLALILGIFAVLFSQSACSDKEKCCVFSYAGSTTRVCEDDEDEWRQYADSWEEYVTYFESYGGECD